MMPSFSMTLGKLLAEYASLFETEVQRKVTGLSLDSRQVEPGDLFVAVSGFNVDGRDYIASAIEAGAVAVLQEGPVASCSEESGVPVIHVADFVSYLGKVADRFYGLPSHSMSVVGITGTNGKTSTAWFVRDALNRAGKKTGLLGTLGAMLDKDVHASPESEKENISTGHTTPDVVKVHALLAWMKQQDIGAVAMEVSSHALDQGRIEGVEFDVAVFTNLGRDHLDYHQTEEAYFNAKLALFKRDSLQSAVINLDDPRSSQIKEICQASIIGFSLSQAAADITPVDVQYSVAGMQVLLRVQDEKINVLVPLYGEFNLENLMATAGVLLAMQYSAAQIEQALNGVTSVPGRMQPVIAENAGDDLPLVLVDFAHTADGLEQALKAVRKHFSGLLVCVFGAGGDRDKGKRPLMGAVADQYADQIIVTSDNPRSESQQAIAEQIVEGITRKKDVVVEADRKAAIGLAITQAREACSRGEKANEGDRNVVLIAGKGHESNQYIGKEIIPFNDVEVARAFLETAVNGGGLA